MKIKNGYTLSKQWFEFVHETKENITPIHGALYFWIMELNNQLKWKEVIGLPTRYSMEIIGVKSYQSYKRALDDLVRWGFIRLVAKAYNQHTCNQVALVLKAKAEQKQRQKQSSYSKTIQTDKNYFKNEKIDSEFKTFLDEQNRFLSANRIEALIKNLEILAPDNDELKIKIINQAIAGGYSDFRPRPAKGKEPGNSLLKINVIPEDAR
jgi:hypothetical protein